MGSGGADPRFLNLRSGWESVVKYIPTGIYPPGTNCVGG